jgi:hypothetical protein
LRLTEVYRASWPFVWLIVLGMVILVIFRTSSRSCPI